MALPGVNATRRRAAPQPLFPSGLSAGNRGFGLTSSLSGSAGGGGARLSGALGINGLTTLVALLAGLWAVDRYVVAVPGVRGGKR